MSETTRCVDGAWTTYYWGDHAATKVFATEVEALRDALAEGKRVVFVPWGEAIGVAENRKHHEAAS